MIHSKKKSKYIGYVLGILFIVFCISVLRMLFGGNASKDMTLVVAGDSTPEQVMEQMRQANLLEHETSFKITCKLLFYKNVKPGKYKFEKGESNFSMVKKLRHGQHYPVKVTFTGARTVPDLLKKLSKYDFYFDWKELERLLSDKDFLDNYAPMGEKLTPQTVIAVFRPNTYEFYYDITAKDFFEKIYSYYEKFWTEERQQKAQKIGLTPMQVCVLASIVEEENHKPAEQPRIAGLYMNRLHKGMLLQADPTVIFAVGDFSIRRVLDAHIKKDSPYNTYKYKGLPPGPIRLPSDNAIDAVLNYEHHDYIYMCAKEDFSGAHNFAKTYSEHLQNARRYQKALNARG
ncbi:MAG: endolytic transglycosylase MltG [Bacteroidales bacterium]|jgi:UPF0755 protein|nr:endolytic transglycosylase MltG [Bacteroidales bacterium]